MDSKHKRSVNISNLIIFWKIPNNTITFIYHQYTWNMWTIVSISTVLVFTLKHNYSQNITYLFVYWHSSVDQTRYFKEIGISLILTMITVAVLCPFKIMKMLIAYDIHIWLLIKTGCSVLELKPHRCVIVSVLTSEDHGFQAPVRSNQRL